jgi:glucose/arabinose dehydrogenase
MRATCGGLVLLGAFTSGILGGHSEAWPPTPKASASSASAAKQVAGGLRLVGIGTFRTPVHVTAPPGDPSRVMVVERNGRIRVVRGGEVQRTPFLDIRGRVIGGFERGLLSLAFAPDYVQSGRFYVYYTGRDRDQRVVEFRRRDADHADARSARTVLRMADDEPTHNGGQLAFGPDGQLYVGTGDGGGKGDRHGARGNAQDLGSMLGKLLRIDPRPRRGRPYSIPARNPFRRRAGARDEIYAYGLRNPWRFSFDRNTGDLAIGDVGQDLWEEINFAPRGRARGANFGWRPFEGRARYTPGESAPGHVEPVIVHSHRNGSCAIVGGVVVRDRGVPLYGRYVYGDVCRRRLFSATLSAAGARAHRRTSLRISNVTSFGEDALGRVYVTSLQGRVYRIAAE